MSDLVPSTGGVPDLELLTRVEGELADVERALERLDEGTYGTCETCGASLPDEVLDRAPSARRCVQHATGA